MAFTIFPHHIKPLQYPPPSSSSSSSSSCSSSLIHTLTFPSIIPPSNSKFTITLIFNSAHHTFKGRPCHALHMPVPSSFTEDMTNLEEETETKPRAERFAEKIQAIPNHKRHEFVENMIEKRVGSKKVAYFNDLVMGLLMAQELDIALKVFDEMPGHGVMPDWWTFSLFIRYHCRKNDPDEGRKLLDRLIESGFRPNIATLTILVDSFCSRGKIQRAIEVLQMMENRFGCNPSIPTYNQVLKGLCFVGRVEEACKMLKDLKNKEGVVSLDIYSYTAVMDGLCKVGRSQEAVELLEEAISMGLTPNAVTYNALFNGYCKEGKPKKGFRMLKMMKERGCEPDYITYSTLFHGLLKWGEILGALWVYNQMVEVGFKVDERMMNTLLRALCRKSWVEEGILKVAFQVYDQMKRWDYAIYPDTYYVIIHTFCVGKEIDGALITFDEMVKLGHFPRMATINRIVSELSKEGRIDKAISVLVVLFEACRIPSKISYNILIEELSRQGQLLGASSIYGSALKRGVIPHMKPLCV